MCANFIKRKQIQVNIIKFKFFLLIWIISLAIFLLHFKIVKTAVYGDGIYYYSISRSLVVDRNLDFENEYRHYQVNVNQLPNSYYPNKYPPGVSLIWIPGMALVHLFLNGDGYGFFYQLSAALTSISIAVFALYLLNSILKDYFGDKVSKLTTLALLFSTNLLFYSSFDVINSHGLSFSFLVFAFYIFLKTKKYKYFLTGLFAGFLGIIRSLDILFILLFLSLLFIRKISFKEKVINSLKIIIGAVFGFLPQLLFWKIIYGNLFKNPYLSSSEGFNLLNPHILGLLLNNNTGLTLWTPLVFLSFVGLFFWKRKIRYLFILFLVIQFYLISSWSSWDQGGSFGVRMMVGSLVILSFGLASIIQYLLSKYKENLTYLIIVLTGIMNISLIIIYLINH